jgi:hypothetical protein
VTNDTTTRGKGERAGAGMELGTAIFLSAAMIAVVLLYGFTKDRVRWGRFFKWAGIGGALIAVGGTIITISIDLWTNRRVVLTTVSDVSLGDNYKDIIFKWGEPTEKCYSADNKLVRLEYEKDYAGLYIMDIDIGGQVTRIVESQAGKSTSYFFQGRCLQSMMMKNR